MSKIRRIKNWPGDLNNSLVAPAWERDMVSDGWLPADVAVVGEADLDVRIAAVLVVSPEFEQAGTVLLVAEGAACHNSLPHLWKNSLLMAVVYQ